MTSLTAYGEVRDPYATPVPRRHPSHWISGCLALLLAAGVAYGLATNESFEWSVFGRYLFSAPTLQGLAVTIELSLVSQIIAVLIGCALALLGESRNPVFRAFAKAYVGFFRGVPLLVILLICFNAALFVPQVGIGTYSWDTNTLITGFSAAIIGLSLHEGAFAGEIIRAGFMSVPEGQREAAHSLGMKRRVVMRVIVIPQAIRVIIPPTGNQFIGLLKATSLVSVIGGGDLLTRAQQVYGSNFKVIPLLMVVSFWYLLIVTIATFGQHFLEKKYSVSSGARAGVARARLAEEPV
ncbi:amino acid ABC transporter permease [Pseudonocardia kujensis]|uniref:amino acid ABC transporter permease n=1 Tax=Pseudonocardia kujensis TaxID=1128675 RepID=UPI001E348F65|nr:amino acid ABC transporter permease [Pseudonocardia kujensis]MCE0762502.1 amino acid ABC transporter permease [Pseudonocardia kujensis]